MKDTRSEGRVNASQHKYVDEVLRGARAARRDHRYAARLSKRSKLIKIVSAADAVARHAIQHDFSGTTVLSFPQPIDG